MRRSMIALLIMMAAAAGGARADNQPLGFVLSFEGIPFGNPVGDYYNGAGDPTMG